MAKKRERICKNCEYWLRDYNWDKNLPRIDRRKMGDCCCEPPKLCQNIIPFVIRDKGLNNLRSTQEQYQIRPLTEGCDPACRFYKEKEK